MVDELGMGDVRDQATPQHPDMRELTVGDAVNAMVRNGLGGLNQARSLVPRCFQPTPTSRRMAPRVAPAQRTDDARGRAVDTREDAGVTALYRLMAATAATRLGVAPTCAPRDRPSVPVDGRDNRAEEPEAAVMPSTRGDRREPRRDLNHGRLAWMVEPQAGLPVLRPPLRGHRREAHACGPVVKDHLAQ